MIDLPLRKFRGNSPLARAEIEEELRLIAAEAERNTPKEPSEMSNLPRATHRIFQGQAVCDGDEGAWCHQYPSCMHETWPCGDEYIPHKECWVLPWLNATDLYDTADDESAEFQREDGSWPDGIIDYEWEGEYVVWHYLDEPQPQVAGGLDYEQMWQEGLKSDSVESRTARVEFNRK